jgi:hypothetical protein
VSYSKKQQQIVHDISGSQYGAVADGARSYKPETTLDVVYLFVLN